LGDLTAVATGLSIGTVAAAFVTPRWVRKTRRENVIASSLAAAGLAVITLCTELQPELFVVASVFLGFATQAAKICSDALIQTSVNDEHRGRAFALVDMTFNVSYVTAAAVAAAILPADARSEGDLLTAGALWCLVGAGYGRAARRSVAA
jgi:MFS family permease